jgi:CRP-like cAMP-binding protein
MTARPGDKPSPNPVGRNTEFRFEARRQRALRVAPRAEETAMSNNIMSRQNGAPDGSRPTPRGVAASFGLRPGGAPAQAARVEPGAPAADSLNGLLANRLLKALPAEDFARLLPHLEPVSLAPCEVLYRGKEGVRAVFFPESAVVSHLHVLADGSTAEADMIGREGVIGLSAIFNCPPPAHWTEVVVGGNALRIRMDALRQEFARCGAFQQLVLAYAGARIAQLSHRAVCGGNHRVEERLCNWLLMVRDRAGDDRLALTHEQIARHLGTRRAGVTEAANSLRERGVIDYSRGLIRITDGPAMEAAACECYPAVKARFDGFAS